MAVKTAKPVDDAQASLDVLAVRLGRAKAAITRGNDALGKGQTDRAVQHFQDAVRIAPSYEPAKERLAFAQRLIGEQGGGMSAIGRLERIRRIAKQRAEVNYTKALQRAREAMHAMRGAADFARASQEVQYAQTLLATKTSIWPNSCATLCTICLTIIQLVYGFYSNLCSFFTR